MRLRAVNVQLDAADRPTVRSTKATEGQPIDYYEVLQLSPNANAETLERVYRLLAKRYHPDNQTTGEPNVFVQIQQAYEVLSDPARRAAYDVQYDETRRLQWQIFDQGSAADGREQDRRVFHGILSLLYIARRRDPASGGLGAVNLERLLAISQQELEFALWYMRQRGWILTLDNGQIGITADGVDKLGSKDLDLPHDRLLPESTLVTQNDHEPRHEKELIARNG
jgi:curved DNA-binding protein